MKRKKSLTLIKFGLINQLLIASLVWINPISKFSQCKNVNKQTINLMHDFSRSKAGDILNLDAIDFASDDAIKAKKEFWREINFWYKALIPFGRVNLNWTKDVDGNSKSETLEDEIKKATIIGLNEAYGDDSGEFNHYTTPILISDIEWEFQIGSNEVIDYADRNKLMTIKGIDQGENTRVIGILSLSVFEGMQMWEWVDFNRFNQEWWYGDLADSISNKFDDYLKKVDDNIKSDGTLEDVKKDLEVIVLDEFNAFLKAGNYDSSWGWAANFETELTTIREEELIIEFDENSQQKLNEIENLNLTIKAPLNETGFTIGKVHWEEMNNYLYKWGWNDKPNRNIGLELLPLWIILGFLVMSGLVFAGFKIYKHQK